MIIQVFSDKIHSQDLVVSKKNKRWKKKAHQFITQTGRAMYAQSKSKQPYRLWLPTHVKVDGKRADKAFFNQIGL